MKATNNGEKQICRRSSENNVIDIEEQVSCAGAILVNKQVPKTDGTNPN